MADLEIIWPHFPFVNAAFTPSSRALTQVNNNVFTVGFMPKATTITEVRIYLGSITSSGGKIRVGLMGVSATDGSPTGTYLNNGTSDVYIDIGVNLLTANAWRTVDIPNYTCARGEIIGLIVECLDDAPSPGGNGTWGSTVNVSSGWGNADNVPSTPYSTYRFAANTTQTTQNAFPPHSFMRDASQAFWFPQNTITTTSLENDAGSQLYGALFQLPSGMASTYKISGIKLNGRRSQAGANFDVILYDSAGTVLQNVSIDSDMILRNSASSQQITSFIYFDESTLSTLNTGSQYRLVIKPTTVNQFVVYNHTFDLATDKKAYVGLDAQYDLTTNAGTDPTTGWTNTTTALPPFSLIITDITTTATGAGYSANFNQGFGG